MRNRLDEQLLVPTCKNVFRFVEANANKMNGTRVFSRPYTYRLTRLPLSKLMLHFALSRVTRPIYSVIYSSIFASAADRSIILSQSVYVNLHTETNVVSVRDDGAAMCCMCAICSGLYVITHACPATAHLLCFVLYTCDRSELFISAG